MEIPHRFNLAIISTNRTRYILLTVFFYQFLEVYLKDTEKLQNFSNFGTGYLIYRQKGKIYMTYNVHDETLLEAGAYVVKIFEKNKDKFAIVRPKEQSCNCHVELWVHRQDHASSGLVINNERYEFIKSINSLSEVMKEMKGMEDLCKNDLLFPEKEDNECDYQLVINICSCQFILFSPVYFRKRVAEFSMSHHSFTVDTESSDFKLKETVTELSSATLETVNSLVFAIGLTDLKELKNKIKRREKDQMILDDRLRLGSF
jgi:hypothetical protein